MHKLTRIKTMTMAIVMGLALCVAAAAQTSDNNAKGERHGRFGREGGRGEFGGRGNFGMMGFRNLDLTDAQKAQLKQIHESHRQSIAPLMQEIRAKRQEIHQASANGSFNEALVTQKLIEIAPLEAKMMGEQARIHQESLAVLTADQKAKLDQMREQAKTRWVERGANKQQKRQ